MLRLERVGLAVGLSGLAACSLAWDDLDPRQELTTSTSSVVSSSAVGASSTTTASSSSSGGAGGGGAGGSGGAGGASDGTKGSTSSSSSSSSGSGGMSPVMCTVPGTAPATQNDKGCSGNLLATGSMNGSDDGADAAANCEANHQAGGTCCSYHLQGQGEWFLTDGAPVDDGGVPSDTFRSAGPCVF